MTKNFNNRVLVVSQKIYGRLLLAYPKAHREEYGPAMRQLFRDQGRDAWNESQGWGVAKLWLRVLPDLLKTSFVERLAALNKRKSMSDNVSSLIQPRTAFLKVFVTVFLLIFCASVAVTFLLPKSYASSAKIFLQYINDKRDTTKGSDVIQAEMEAVKSDRVLGAAIIKLDLDKEWSKKYANGKLLDIAETIKLLRQRVIVNSREVSGFPRERPVFEIQVYDEIPAEAFSITKAIVDSYLNINVDRNSPDQKKSLRPKVIQSPTPPWPVRPNKPLNIGLGVIFGIISASALGVVAAFIAALIRKRKQKLSAAR